MVDSAVDTTQTLMQFLYRTPIGLIQADDSGGVEMMNPMAARLLMPLASDGNLDNLFAALGDVAPQLRTMAHDFVADSGVICESLRIDLGTGHPKQKRPEVLSISLFKLDVGRLMAVLVDSTSDAQRERRTIASKLADAARIDNLTKMPNRCAVLETLQLRINRFKIGPNPGFAVLFINCDRFKQINDAFGQNTGDQLLGLIGQRLCSILRIDDGTNHDNNTADVVARIGGDEFVVMLNEIGSVEDVHTTAKRIAEVLAEGYQTEHHTVSCSVSMGIVLLDKDVHYISDADAVLQDASIAMTEAKKAGGGRHVMFDTVMREKAAYRGSMETELRHALAENQLFVMYQPVVGVNANGSIDRCAGVEALVRWRHPVRGMVSPLEFIGIAEESGLIGPLGDFVLSTACQDFVRWKKDLGVFAPRMLAVNLSRAQLAAPEWHLTVEQILHRTHMKPEWLQLEITESLAAQDSFIQQKLRDLKSIGLQLALDDFGTGYSSLACLHLLPVDTVKIDRSFVSKVDVSPHHRVLVEATVRVAHSLGMNTVAEGIETNDQADVIRELACDKGQGFLYSRPLVADELAKWMAVSPDMAHILN